LPLKREWIATYERKLAMTVG